MWFIKLLLMGSRLCMGQKKKKNRSSSWLDRARQGLGGGVQGSDHLDGSFYVICVWFPSEGQRDGDLALCWVNDGWWRQISMCGGQRPFFGVGDRWRCRLLVRARVIRIFFFLLYFNFFLQGRVMRIFIFIKFYLILYKIFK